MLFLISAFKITGVLNGSVWKKCQQFYIDLQQFLNEKMQQP